MADRAQNGPILLVLDEFQHVARENRDIGSIVNVLGRERVSYYNCVVDIHPSAHRHDIADDDIEHAVEQAMTIENQDDDTRLYLGSSRSAALLEVVTIMRDDGSELVIHAMPMRAKYQRLLPEG